MIPQVVRAFPFKDIETLLAAKVLCRHFATHKTALVALRPGWNDPFIDGFKARIDFDIANILGIDPQTALSNLTRDVTTKVNEAIQKLGIFRDQLLFDFRKEPLRLESLLTDLGFTAFYKRATRSKDQETIIELLTAFAGFMTFDLQAEIENKGMSGDVINDLVALATSLKDSNVAQEEMKGTKTGITADNISEINEIYREAMLICKLGRKVTARQPAEKDKFSFKKIVKNMNAKPLDPP